MKIVSVQVGDARPSPAASVGFTGIDKEPVSKILVTTNGVEGDTVFDQKNHGGVDQAVYIYSSEDYHHWEKELGQKLVPGMFGENITVSSMFDEDEELFDRTVRIGDRYKIGNALLEVTAPRIPCGTFAEKMGEPNWVERFREAERPGYYCRVLSGGTIEPGDSVQRLKSKPSNVSVVDVYKWRYDRSIGTRELLHALASPLAIRTKQSFEKRLKRIREPEI